MTDHWLTDAGERDLYESTVHGLRMLGWSKFEAESEALERLERARAAQQELGEW